MEIAAEKATCDDRYVSARDLKVARRVIALRERLGLTQQAFADRTEGAFDRSFVAQLETGVNKGSTARVRRALAKAASVPLEAMSGYLDGDVDLDGMMAQQTARVLSDPDTVRPGNLSRVAVPEPADPGGPSLEAALGDVFDPKRHTLGDTRVVEETLGATFRFEDGADAHAAARTWLDAAAALRREGKAVTMKTLLERITYGKSERARQRGAERDAEINAEADRAADELGLIRQGDQPREPDGKK